MRALFFNHNLKIYTPSRSYAKMCQKMMIYKMMKYKVPKCWIFLAIILLFSLLTAPVSFILLLIWIMGGESAHSHYQLVYELYRWYTFLYPPSVFIFLLISYKTLKYKKLAYVLLILPLTVPTVGIVLNVREMIQEAQTNHQSWVASLKPKPDDYVCAPNIFITRVSDSSRPYYLVSYHQKNITTGGYYYSYQSLKTKSNLSLSHCKNAKGESVPPL